MSTDPDALGREQRLGLINLVCSFAWSDFDLGEEEREHIRALCRRFELNAEDRQTVEGWLELPPDTDELADPGAIPRAHREAFLAECRGIILADGDVDVEESLAYRVFRDILTAEGRRDD